MIRISSLCLILMIGIVFAASGENFNDFLKADQTDFSTYQKETEQAFKAYKQIVAEEYAKFQEQLSRYWKKPEVSDRKKWVEYSDDLQTRKSVDFENKVIEVDIIVPQKKENPKKDQNIDDKINAVLMDLLLEDKQTAVNRDKLNGNIQKRINQENVNTTSDKVEKELILTTAVTGTPNPTDKQVKKTVRELKNKGTMVTEPAKEENKDVVKLKIPLPSDFTVKKANEYKTDVSYYAKERGIDGALVFAVIHTESAFNPMARSPVPAYGLMQIVPQSAGLDATQFIYGKQKILSPTYLYNSKNNINIGTAYIYILYYRYLKDIENSQSRLYCSIAAYNTGAGNVARAFTGSTNIGKAVSKINRMSSSAVYDRLMDKLPHAETRKYLSTVSKRLDLYR